ncbi:DUF3383 domain-containing protein [Campylobacter sp. faydin G-105]|uniref:DUF3383 domain-containing protein n=1 Tax=Campylobacter anatolicus TaxID=2829105 RepID=UPI001B9347C3|nr:DUF3383 domain-containing protein [Campylobacter anatolicus]MBR8461478.1 DUF3383 domain-containing protein [Campylobacter anatolicus]
MSLSIKRVVNVALNTQGQIAKNRDFSIVAILTDEPCEAFSDINRRFINVASAQDAALNFGSNAKVVAATKAVFSVSGIKKAIIAKWVKTERETTAMPNELRGSALSVGISRFKDITDGSFKLSVGGAVKIYSEIDLSEAVDLAEVATKITQKISPDGLKAVYDIDGNRFKIIATQAGANADTKLGYLEQNESGTFLGEMLNLIDGKADIKNGTDSITLKKESLNEALDKLYNATQGFYGVYSAITLNDDEILALDEWVSTVATPCIAGYTLTKQGHLGDEKSNVIKKIAKKDSGRFIAVYNNTGEPHVAAELLAQSISTNWEASYSAKTLKFKNLTTAQSDESITLDIAQKCDNLGVNYYTDYDGVSMVTEGVSVGGKFIDETVGLDAFNDRVQKEVFSTLKAAKKIPQTDKGQVKLIAAIKRVCNQFVANGFIAPGQWRGDDVGTLTSGDYLELGYYVYSPSYTEQLQTDREARKATPLNVAIKLAGAIHSVDILINYNR